MALAVRVPGREMAEHVPRLQKDIEVVPRNAANERPEIRGAVTRRDAPDENPVSPTQCQRRPGPPWQ